MTETIYTEPTAISDDQYRKIAKEIQGIIESSYDSNSFFNLSDNAKLLQIIPNDIARLFSERFTGPFGLRNLIVSSLMYLNIHSPACCVVYLDRLKERLLYREGNNLPTRGFQISSDNFFESWDDREITGLSKEEDRRIISAVKEAGCLGTVSVKCDNKSDIRISDGCVFDFSTPPGFFIDQDEISLIDSKIIIFEGSINEVSQIHHILEQASSLKKTIIFFASSFSKDVAYTLAKNIEMKKLKVIPFELSDSIDNLNQIYDLSFLTKSIPITKENGGNLSMVKVIELPIVDHVSINFLTSKIKLRISHNIVSKLRHQLLEKIEDEKIDDKKDIFRKRLNRLMNHNIHLQIKAPKYLEHIIHDRVNYFIGSMTAIARENALYSRDVMSAKNLDYAMTYLPFYSTLNAIKKAETDARLILNTSVIITMDNG